MMKRRIGSSPARQQYLVVDANGHEVARLPTVGKACGWAAKLDEQFPADAPHRVCAFRSIQRVA